MPVPLSALRAEIDKRVAKTRALMAERGYDVLIAYGNNKVYGSVRYLSDYFPDRAGWISLTGQETQIVDGAAVVLPREGAPALLVDPGLMPTREVCIDRIIGGDGFAAKKGDGLSARNVLKLVGEVSNVRKIGIETFDKFPAPLFLEIQQALSGVAFERSTIVEELRLIKSPFDLEMMRRAARVADLGHETFFAALQNGVGRTELELIRETEQAMRLADPIYEESCSSSPSLICSGFPVAGALLHIASPSKRIEPGDIVHWDICMRYEGYPVDSSRTRSVGRMSDAHRRAYDAILEVHDTVTRGAKPGVLASDLVNLAEQTARKRGYELWNRFLGHGLGWDIHERPDMGIEETPLAANMVLAIEPRLTSDGIYLLGNEDMVVVTENGGVSLTQFPKTDIEIV